MCAVCRRARAFCTLIFTHRRVTINLFDESASATQAELLNQCAGGCTRIEALGAKSRRRLGCRENKARQCVSERIGETESSNAICRDAQCV